MSERNSNKLLPAVNHPPCLIIAMVNINYWPHYYFTYNHIIAYIDGLINFTNSTLPNEESFWEAYCSQFVEAETPLIWRGFLQYLYQRCLLPCMQHSILFMI